VTRLDEVGRVCILCAAVIGSAVPGAAVGAQDRITNAAIERRSAAQGLEREIRAIAARGRVVWIAYRVPKVAAPRHTNCFDRTRIVLEPPTELFVLARFDMGMLVQVRTATPECEIDAGGAPVVWLDDVKPDESVRWLNSLVDAASAGVSGRDQVTHPALAAMAMHETPSAVRTLIATARDNASSRLRGQALFWLAQRAGNQALTAIADAIDRDPDAEVKKRAVFALSQLPKDEGVPKLIEVARTNRNPAVRKQAMFWLGQSNDARALKFFEEILLR
jgi:hypothetical protein